MDMRSRSKFLLCVTTLLGVGGWLALVGWSNTTLIQVLAREGVVTTGKVLDHSSESYSRRSSNLRLTVEFTPTNRPTVTKTFAVDGTTYHPAVASGEVPIRYLPNQPESCQAGSMAVLPFQVILGLGSVMVFAGVYLVVFHGYRVLTPSP